MKILTAILLSVAIFLGACKDEMSPSERSNIELMISLHNTKAYMQFIKDSMSEMGKVKVNYIQLKNTKELNEYLESHGAVFKNQWNSPYKIERDFDLTYDKYIEFCKANKKDQKIFYKFID